MSSCLTVEGGEAGRWGLAGDGIPLGPWYARLKGLLLQFFSKIVLATISDSFFSPNYSSSAVNAKKQDLEKNAYFAPPDEGRRNGKVCFSCFYFFTEKLRVVEQRNFLFEFNQKIPLLPALALKYYMLPTCLNHLLCFLQRQQRFLDLCYCLHLTAYEDPREACPSWCVEEKCIRIVM